MCDKSEVNQVPDKAAIIAAMQLAWSDHQHARGQTWNTVTTVVALTIGMVTVDQKLADWKATIVIGTSVCIMAFLGILIARHHRKYQRRKFAHIMKCEEALGLRTMNGQYVSTGGILHGPDNAEKLPTLKWCNINTVSFIMLMHAVIIAFALTVMASRYHQTNVLTNAQQTAGGYARGLAQPQP